MDDLDAQLKAMTRFSLLSLSACLLAWALMPEWRPYAAGLAMGMVVSLINMRYLGMKIKQMTILVISKESKRFNLGFLTRAAMVVLTVLLAKEFDQVNLIATIIGLFISPFIAAAVGFASLLKKKN